MPLRPLARCALLAALGLACGERAGDPVVKLESSEPPGPTSAGAGSGGSSSGGSGGGAGSAGAAPDADGPIGLCGSCDSSDDCGDANDACVSHDGTSFCARDCDEGFGCPAGYTCVELEGSRVRQCVPEEPCLSPLAAPSVDDVRAYLLSRINALRVARDQAPLEESRCLDGLAQESALAYARTSEPLGKYVNECDPVWPNCSCGWIAQTEVAVAYYGLDWQSSLDTALANERLRDTVSGLDLQRVGIGFWISGDEAWLALSFG